MFDSNVMHLARNPNSLPVVNQRHFRSSRAAVMTAFVIAVGAALALLVHFLVPLSFNVASTLAVQSITFPGLQEFMRLISGFGNAPKVVLITVIALTACNKRREAFFLTLSGLGGWFLAMQLKQLFGSQRPTAELVNVFHQWPTGSFPSGHLVFYVCYFGFLYFVASEKLPQKSIFRRLVMVTLLLLIALVGLSRLYLGEHWLSDLPGSYLLGAFWLYVCLKLYRFWTGARNSQRLMAESIAGYR
ncbi:MAG TPA: phosphatase PAP2 family protein [Pyrinomonadaceae bacterium]|nr:phosphatase PAP2 family protein [Pyrinomonadaceae bacterium]